MNPDDPNFALARAEIPSLTSPLTVADRVNFLSRFDELPSGVGAALVQLAFENTTPLINVPSESWNRFRLRCCELAAQGRFASLDDDLIPLNGLDHLYAMFLEAWKAREQQMAFLQEIRGSFAWLCQSEDGEIVNLVVTGVLEHLFGDSEQREFFRVWQNDESLRKCWIDASYLSGAKDQV